MGSSRRAAALGLRLKAAGDHRATNDWAEHIVNIMRIYFAPGTADSLFQEVVRFLEFRRTGETLHGFIPDVELLRRRAEPK